MKFSYTLAAILIAGQVWANNNLADIQLEINYLSQKQAILQKKITKEMFLEEHSEIDSANKMLSYHWKEAVSGFKDAEDHENTMHNYQSELKQVDERLRLLMQEAENILK